MICWSGDKNFTGAGALPGGPPSFGLVHVVVESGAALQPCGKGVSANGRAVRVRAGEQARTEPEGECAPWEPRRAVRRIQMRNHAAETQRWIRNLVRRLGTALAVCGNVGSNTESNDAAVIVVGRS